MLDEAVEEKAGGEKVRIGMCVSGSANSKLLWARKLIKVLQVIRGNSVVMLEVRLPVPREISLRLRFKLRMPAKQILTC